MSCGLLVIHIIESFPIEFYFFFSFGFIWASLVSLVMFGPVCFSLWLVLLVSLALFGFSCVLMVSLVLFGYIWVSLAELGSAGISSFLVDLSSLVLFGFSCVLLVSLVIFGFIWVSPCLVLLLSLVLFGFIWVSLSVFGFACDSSFSIDLFGLGGVAWFVIVEFDRSFLLLGGWLVHSQYCDREWPDKIPGEALSM